MAYWFDLTTCLLGATLFTILFAVPLSPTKDKLSELESKSKTSDKNSDYTLTQKMVPKLSQLSAPSKPQKDNKKTKEEDSDLDKLQKQTDSIGSGYDDYDYENIAYPKPVNVVNEQYSTEKTIDHVPLEDFALKQMHERAQYMRMAEVKESILNKLRLIAPPNITALKMNNKLKRNYPGHIIPLVPQQPEFQKDEPQEDNFHATITTVIEFATDFPESKNPKIYPVASIAYFDLPDTVGAKNIDKATLMIYIACPTGKNGSNTNLTISDTLHKEKPLVHRPVTLSHRGHWEHIDISREVMTWAEDDSNNYGLIVNANLDGQNVAYLIDDPLEVEKERVNVDGGITARPHRTPLIKIILDGTQKGRYKRGGFNEIPQSCDIEDKDDRCCRYKFIIDFDQMGKEFEFILQPRRYLANYCAGSCPTYYLPKDVSSKLLMGLPKPKLQRCCTPLSKSPIQILYYNEKGSVMLGDIPDMSIDKCNCS